MLKLDTRRTILVVDDEPAITNTLIPILNGSNSGFVTLAANTIREAMTIMSALTPDLVLLDVVLPDADGLKQAIELRDQLGLNVVLMSGWPESSRPLEYVESEGTKPFGILAKPIPPSELIAALRDIFRDQPQKTFNGAALLLPSRTVTFPKQGL